ADFSHDPGFIPELVSGLDGADLVIASRFVDGGRDLRGFFRRALSRFSNLYVKNVLGIAVRDCTSGFRAFSASALAGVKPGRLTSKGPSIVQEALLKCLSNGIRIKEVPYTFYERRSGRSKLSFKTLFKTLFVATGMALSYRLRGRLA
ncbi:MAG TPA: dolichol-phosphate mannosyltransferase, partial [bacterium]